MEIVSKLPIPPPPSSKYPNSAPLPAQRIDSLGRTQVDPRAVFALAAPLVANSAVQIILNLTDMWFVGRLSTKALAAIGTVQWLVIMVILVLGGASIAFQTLVAQSCGARRYRRAAQVTWPALWATLGYFNGIGQARVTLLVSTVTALVNVVFNQFFIFQLGWGVAGSGWASTTAQAIGLTLAVTMFLRPEYRRAYKTHLTWKPHARRLRHLLRLGFPLSLLTAADVCGFSIFQMMQVRLGASEGAATQMVTMISAVAYMQGLGVASAGTTLVGQSIGAGNRGWAMRVGTWVIFLSAEYMGVTGVLLALAGPWILPIFAGSHDAEGVAAVALGTRLLWLAAGYQFFAGLNLSSGMCLRGRGRCHRSRGPRHSDVVADISATGGFVHLCTGRWLVSCAAAIRVGCCRRMGSPAHLCDDARNPTIPALALRSVQNYPAVEPKD
ncbi:MAG: MATE family efflux transporter [Steroidobacteraceae bacterium]